jgi:hypothetical protein
VRVLEGIERGTGRGRPFSREGEYMAAIAFTDAQLEQISANGDADPTANA